MVLEGLGGALRKALRKLVRAPLVDEKAVKDFILDLQRALLQSDVNVELVLELSKRVEKKALQVELPPGISRREYVVKMIHDELAGILGRKPVSIKLQPSAVNRLMVVGIQGSGKTTTIAKLANYFRKRGTKVGIVCGDTFRLGAYDQLKQLADKIDVPVYGAPEGKTALKIVKEGVKQFSENNYGLIIIDTAGRHKEEKGLIDEMRMLAKAISPNEIILVVDGTLGQQAAIQAKAFAEATNIGSIIVTKLDGSARGGGALSAVAATGAPIKFIGTGEKIDEIESFNPSSFIGRLLGMGDIRGLLEKIKEAEAIPEKEVAKAFMRGKFTLRDVMEQMERTRKMGPFKKILSMLGFGHRLPEGMEDIAEEKLDRWKVIMQSMTPKELEDPKLLNRSRISRISRGSGTYSKDVRELINQYFMMKKLVKSVSKRRDLAKMAKQFQKV